MGRRSLFCDGSSSNLSGWLRSRMAPKRSSEEWRQDPLGCLGVWKASSTRVPTSHINSTFSFSPRDIEVKKLTQSDGLWPSFQPPCCPWRFPAGLLISDELSDSHQLLQRLPRLIRPPALPSYRFSPTQIRGCKAALFRIQQSTGSGPVVSLHRWPNHPDVDQSQTYLTSLTHSKLYLLHTTLFPNTYPAAVTSTAADIFAACATQIRLRKGRSYTRTVPRAVVVPLDGRFPSYLHHLPFRGQAQCTV